MFKHFPPPLLWRCSARHIRQHPWLMLLSLIGIAIGVAVVVAVDLANSSALRAMNLTNETLKGASSHQIIGGPTGLPDSLYRRLRLDAQSQYVAPVVEGYVVAQTNHQTFRLIGIDPLADAPFRNYSTGGSRQEFLAPLMTTPNAILMDANTALQLKIKRGDTFLVNANGALRALTLVDFIQTHDEANAKVLSSIILCDIATAQELLNQPNKLTRIDLSIDENEPAILSQIRSILPSNAQLIATLEEHDAQTQLTQAFRTNLFAMSLLALLVGAFIIFNTMSFSVLQRRRLFGLQRAIGVSASQIWWLVMLEAFLAGLIGTVAGIALGIGIADSLLNLVTRTVNDLYFNLQVTALHIDYVVIIKSLALGIAVTLLASAPVTWEATRTPPRANLIRSNIEAKTHRFAQRLAIVGIFGIIIGCCLIFFPTRTLGAAFIGLFFLVMGYAMLIPSVVIVTTSMIQKSWPQGHAITFRMAVTGVEKSLSRTAVAMAALMVAIATTIGVSTMIHSFRDSVVQWVEHSLRADIYLSVTDQVETQRSDLTAELISELRGIDFVSDLSIGRRAKIPVGVNRLEVVAVDLPEQGFNGFELLEKVENAWQVFRQETALMISEPYAYHHQLHAGDTLRLPTANGETDFFILGVYRDYGSDQGRVAMRRELYARLWHDDAISNIGIYVADTTKIESVLQSVQTVLPKDKPLLLRSNAEIRRTTIDIFDRTFAITDVLRFLTLGVAFVGIVTALMALQLERARELAVLRAIGFTPRQLWQLVCGETAIMGVFAGTFAIPLGLAMAAILISIINQRAFGWSMTFGIDAMQLVYSIVLAVIASLLASIYPAMKMSRTSPAIALREE